MKMLQLVWNVTTHSEVKGRLLFQLCAAPAGCPGSMLNPNESCKAENPHWNAVAPSQTLLSFTVVLSACGCPGRGVCLVCSFCGRLVTGSQHGGASSVRQQGPCTETHSVCVGLLLPTQGWWQTLYFILRSPRPIRADLTDDVTEPLFKNCLISDEWLGQETHRGTCEMLSDKANWHPLFLCRISKSWSHQSVWPAGTLRKQQCSPSTSRISATKIASWSCSLPSPHWQTTTDI